MTKTPQTTKRAKLVNIEGSQAILLPEEFHFPDGEDEVEVKKVGEILVISSLNKADWSSYLKSLELFAELETLERDQPGYNDGKVKP